MDLGVPAANALVLELRILPLAFISRLRVSHDLARRQIVEDKAGQDRLRVTIRVAERAP